MGTFPVPLLVLLLGALGCLLVGGAVGAVLTRAVAAARAAALRAENDLLSDRLDRAEQEVDDDADLAMALAPLTSSLARVERQVGQLERERAEQWGRLDSQLSAVRTDGAALRSQTAALAGALRSPTARGAWGEVQLRRVVEHAGMLHKVDFDTQVQATDPDGRTVRPDAVVLLPGGKQVVIDAKAPLAAFLEAAAEGHPDDPPARVHERRSRAATAHAKALRGHVDALAAKRYWAAFEPTPEMVVCFVPGESFLQAACEADPALLEHAMSRHVVLATPTTLLALLRTVAMTWQQEALSGNAREVFELGRELHQRLAGLGSSVGRLGRTLHRAVEDYNGMVGTLERRVMVSARRLHELDITDEALPEVVGLRSSVRPLLRAAGEENA